MTRDQIQRRLEDAFRRFLGASAVTSNGLVPATVSEGKLYEAYVLSLIVEHLTIDEGYSLTLVGGTRVQLKTSGGPINRDYPRIELQLGGANVAELWTDIEFLSLSYCTRWKQNRTPRSLFVRPRVTKGDFHELDIVVVEAGTQGRPQYDALWLGVECKNTGYEKGLLREILGVRRELSLLQEPQATKFGKWPRTRIPADPPSCLLVYSTDARVQDYAAPGEMFGIDFFYEPIRV